ncbi:hypothetical protein MASR2M78_32420 [Treponema sp.]
MPGHKHLFLKLLKAELEDYLEDVQDLTLVHHKRYKGQEITDYVYQENQALLSRQVAGISDMVASLDTISVDDYEKVEDIAAEVDERVKNKILEFEHPEAVYNTLKRKLLKILRYVSDS